MKKDQILHLALTAANIALLDDDDEGLKTLMAGNYSVRTKKASIRRIRSKFTAVTHFLNDSEFTRAFRMTRTTFRFALSRLYPYLQRNNEIARRSSGGVVEPEVRLAVSLRMMAGGSYLDQMMCWGIGRSMTFRVFLDTVQVIVGNLKMPGLPLNDETKLKKIADAFQNSRRRINPLYGCVGALDGIAIGIKKPPDEFVPRNFYCRKGMYALPVQAVVDSHLRFRHMACTCTGSTHDAIAFASSALAKKLERGYIIDGYWIAGDAAYVPVTGLLTPWSKSFLHGENGIYADSFNFYHSSHRIHVEQAFGVLVRRWGILWKPIQYHIKQALTIISAAMRLHNLCIEQDGEMYLARSSGLFESETEETAFQEWWVAAAGTRCEDENVRGHRRDTQTSLLRDLLTSSLKTRGITRPALC